MKKIWLLSVLTLVLGVGTQPWAGAQEEPPAPLPAPTEMPAASASASSTEQELLQQIMNLRLEIDKQRREIQALREEVAQVYAKVEGKPYRKPAPPSPSAKPPGNGAETLAQTEKPAKPEEKTKAQEHASTTGKIYKVKQGDTLSSIARLHKLKLEELQGMNPSVNPKSLKPGMELKIP